MELIEKNDAGTTLAKLRAMIWRNTLQPLRRKFWEATGRDIANGLKVMVQLSATCHPVYGLSATITDIDPSYTLGDLERLRREILERLQREGILDKNKEQRLSPAPQRIAVISSEGAAGYGDFINQLQSNPRGFQFYTKLFPAIMQGERTSSSVREALEQIEMTVDLWDCVVIIRGGGATTDMNGFDDYELARAVATCGLPVIVGIGHERDRCVLDEIACVRCKTPTAVAAFLLESLSTALEKAEQLAGAIAAYAAESVKGEQRQLSQIEGGLEPAIFNILQHNALRLKSIQETIPVSVARKTDAERSRLAERLKMVGVAAGNATAMRRQYLDSLGQSIAREAVLPLERAAEKLRNLSELAGVLDPRNTLRRGYSVTRIAGRAVTDAATMKTGDKIVTTLFSGTLTSQITATENGN